MQFLWRFSYLLSFSHFFLFPYIFVLLLSAPWNFFYHVFLKSLVRVSLRSGPSCTPFLKGGTFTLPHHPCKCTFLVRCRRFPSDSLVIMQAYFFYGFVRFLSATLLKGHILIAYNSCSPHETLPR